MEAWPFSFLFSSVAPGLRFQPQWAVYLVGPPPEVHMRGVSIGGNMWSSCVP